VKLIGKGVSHPNHFKIPMYFQLILNEKVEKWKKYILEFTIAHDPENGIWAIAIVHPKDNFSRKIGAKIVLGRLERVKSPTKPYKITPRTIYFEEEIEE
jgi:hypothetical protein